MAKLHTPLCDRLGIPLPIIQAPMPSASTPELVAAVSTAGALGSFGSAHTQPEAMQRNAEAVRAHTNAPFNVNLFVSKQSPAVDVAAQRGALDAVAGYYQELGLPPPEPVRPPYAPDLDAQLRAVEEIRPAFISCLESGASRVHKERVLNSKEDETLVTEKFSGKPAQAIANRFLRETHERAAPQLVFPAQNVLTRKLRTAAAKAGIPDFVAMYAGQATPLSRALPAAELVAALEAETLECLDRLAALRG